MKLRALVFLLASLLFVPAASGTWSIVLVNTKTGEVGLASATCINGYELKNGAGVVVVGKGAGAVQAGGDQGVLWRKHIFDGLMDGVEADVLFDELAPDDPGLQNRQIGIASAGASVTHTGISNANYAGGKFGQVGDVRYAIQGNIMACAQVINKMEKVLAQTRGDMGQVLIEMMRAARSKGGDHRCSCQLEASEAAFGCGCPPDGMVRASSTAYMVVSRLGDVDGVCTPAKGCANGEYYMDLEALEWLPMGSVYELEKTYADFRKEWRGHADHIRSQQTLPVDSLPADGLSTTTLELRLVDINLHPLKSGGATVTVEHTEDSAGATRIGRILDHGDGTYSVELIAGVQAGVDEFRVVVDDGKGPVTLSPYPTLASLEPALTTQGGLGGGAPSEPLELLLDGGLERAGRPYVVVANGLGTPPVALAFGALDATGRASETLAHAGLGAPTGRGPKIALSWLALDPVDFVSNPLEVELRGAGAAFPGR